MFRGRRFRGRRRLRFWRTLEQQNTRQRGILVRLGDWWNRRQFYTFHKDEIITRADTCPSPTLAERQEVPEEEDEWNNESESESGDAGHDLDSNDGSLEDYSNQDPSDCDLESDEGDMLETIHEETSLESSPPRVLSRPIVITPSPPRKPIAKPENAPLPPPSSLKLYQKGPADSITGSSLESIDSLVSSHCDDDASTMTPLVTNVAARGVIQTNDAFFDQHLRFLQVQTQPRKVEEVYHSGNEKKDGTIEE